jgi:hypothetical protein
MMPKKRGPPLGYDELEARRGRRNAGEKERRRPRLEDFRDADPAIDGKLQTGRASS